MKKSTLVLALILVGLAMVMPTATAAPSGAEGTVSQIRWISAGELDWTSSDGRIHIELMQGHDQLGPQDLPFPISVRNHNAGMPNGSGSIHYAAYPPEEGFAHRQVALDFVLESGSTAGKVNVTEKFFGKNGNFTETELVQLEDITLPAEYHMLITVEEEVVVKTNITFRYVVQ